MEAFIEKMVCVPATLTLCICLLKKDVYSEIQKYHLGVPQLFTLLYLIFLLLKKKKKEDTGHDGRIKCYMSNYFLFPQDSADSSHRNMFL